MDLQKPLKVRNINTGAVYEVWNYKITSENLIGDFVHLESNTNVLGLLPLNEIEIL